MNQQDLAELAINLHEDICYMVDMDTYEVLFVNDKGRKLLGLKKTDLAAGQTCYSLLQKKEAPCDFCSGPNLAEGEFLNEEYYNAPLQTYFSLRSRVVLYDGRRVRLVFCKDISESYLKVRKMELQINVEEAAMECIRILIGEKDIETAINHLLALVARFYHADRGYIIEFRQEVDLMDNTYEWCREGIEPEKDKLQNLPLAIIDRWMEEFEKDGAFFISMLDGEVDPESSEYKILEEQGVTSLIAAPMKREGEYVGFIGVDNPNTHTNHCLLIQVLSSFVLEELEKRRLMAELERMSYYDELTGVGNRNRYVRYVEELQEKAPRKLGVLYADINGLKRANDTYGHEHGDYMIQCVAELLRTYMGGELFRVGGDEFISISTGIEREDFEERVSKLRNYLREENSFGISIGMNWQADGADAGRQIIGADELMCIDKQSYYIKLMNGKQSHRSGAVRQLTKELESDLFLVYLQPKVSLSDKTIVGAEALVRKRDPRGGLIPPGKFIPIYETDGIIRYVDFFVLRTICELMREWKKKGIFIPISVNLSRITLMEYDIVNQIKKICAEYGIEHKWIVLEVTESISKIDTTLLLRMVDAFKQEGFFLSLDDFGSQYSNLSILSTLDFDEVKFDKSLVAHLGENARSDIIVEHTINMCRSFPKTMSLAEGIETKEQEEILKRYHCDCGQGYLFSKPVSIEAFQELYQKQSGDGCFQRDAGRTSAGLGQTSRKDSI